MKPHPPPPSSVNAYDLLNNEAGDGTPEFLWWESSLICAMTMALEREEFTREEAIALTAAWLAGPRSYPNIGTTSPADE
jgi:hypothetical protein